MDHSNLLRAWPLGQADGRQLVAIERCALPSLTDLIRSGPVEPGVCVRVLGGAAAAADALTRRGLVARDVTPDAVFVHPQHGGVLADLGIPPELFLQAPLEQDPDLLFRSPEELLGQRLDPRSTVYSFGVLLFIALTRAHPYRGPWSDVHAALVAGMAPAASQGWARLPPGVDDMIARAVAPDPEQRYADAAELVRDCTAQLGAEVAPKTVPVDTGPDKPEPRQSSNSFRAPSQRKGRTTSSSAGPATSQPARRGGELVIGLVDSAAAAARLVYRTLVGLVTRRGGRRRPASTKARPPFARRRLILPAVAAIVASALTGIALSRATGEDSGPSYVTQSGLRIQLPPGWSEVGFNPGRSAVSVGMAIGPVEETRAGLAAGKLGSQAAAERMLEGAQAQDGRRVQVRLGDLDAWRYGGLRPRADLVGTGYLVPTARGAVVVVCHAPRDATGRLGECERAATTLEVGGEQPSPLSPVG
jgi:Protein kinase domain